MDGSQMRESRRETFRRVAGSTPVKSRLTLSFVWALYMVVSLGLATGVGIGIADNGDGSRVFSPAGFNPEGDRERVATWHGYVVTDFEAAMSRDPQKVFKRVVNLRYPTLNSYIFVGLGIVDRDRQVTLFTFGLIYVVIGLTIIWLVPLGRGLLVSSLVFGTLALGPYSRWLVSTYADTPAFFGGAAVIIALAVLVRPLSAREHIQVGALFWFGALLIVLSKASYAIALPFILILWLGVLVVFQRKQWKSVVGGFSLVVHIAGLMLTSFFSYLQFTSEDRRWASELNAHSFLMSVAIPSLSDEVLDEIGIPQNIRDFYPESYRPRASGWEEVPNWRETMSDESAINRLRLEVLKQPNTTWVLVSDAVAASSRPEVGHLVANTWQEEGVPPLAVVPWALYQGSNELVKVLLWPISVSQTVLPVLAGLFASAALVVGWSRRQYGDHESRHRVMELFILALSSAIIGGATASAAIFGDAYNELEKHAILSSWLFLVFLAAVVALWAIYLRSVSRGRVTTLLSKR